MTNANEILERILLNMKYDSKKTLSENNKTLYQKIDKTMQDDSHKISKTITDDNFCITKKQKYITQYEAGKPRSEIYPELGIWGDGQCLCENNTECWEWKKECCKKGVVKPDTNLNPKLEIDALGGYFYLPKNTKIISRHNQGESLPDYAIKNYCEKLKIQNCETLVNKKANEVLKPNGVIQFEVDGKKYKGCFTVSKGGVVIPIEKQTFHSGYFTDCKKDGEKWVTIENTKGKSGKGNYEGTTSEFGKEGGQGSGKFIITLGGK